MWFRYFSAFLFLVLGFAWAQDEQITVTTVNVWVKITDKSGKPVTGLTQGDFEIYEDGKRVEPTCFEEVNPATDPAPPPTQTEAQQGQDDLERTLKHIVFLFDLGNTSQNELLHLKKKAIEFVQQLAADRDISIVSLIPGAIQAQVERSRDPEVLLAALEKMTANRNRDIESLNQRRELSIATKRAERLPRKEPRVVAEICELANNFAQQEKALSLEWMDSLKDFDRYIKKQSPEAHQVVLFFSGGISSNPGRQYFEIVRNSNLMKEYTQDEMDILRDFPECEDDGGYDLQSDFKKLVGQLNRYNITFYTVGSRGPINDLLDTVRETYREFHIKDLEFLKEYEDFLSVMADETGGLYFGNSLNFKRGFDAIQADLNHQYLLCYKPPQHSKPGLHSIKVKSRNQGVNIRHRSGYFD